MAWEGTYTNAPKVEIAKREIIHPYFKLDGTEYRRTDTSTEYEYRGLTNAAANTCLTAEATLNNNPQKVPIGAGGYNVRTTEETIGTWTLVP